MRPEGGSVDRAAERAVAAGSKISDEVVPKGPAKPDKKPRRRRKNGSRPRRLSDVDERENMSDESPSRNRKIINDRTWPVSVS